MSICLPISLAKPLYNQKNLGGGYGYAMAIGVVIFLVSFGLSALVNKVTEREILEF